MLHSWIAKASAFTALIVCLACGGGGGTFFNGDRLVGTWKPINISSGNQSSGCPGTINLGNNQTAECLDETFTFNGDMTLVIHNNTSGQDENGTWSLVGNILTMKTSTTQVGTLSDTQNLNDIDITGTTPAGDVVIRIRKL